MFVFRDRPGLAEAEEEVSVRSREEHWQRVYSTRPSDQVSWFQPDPAASLQMIEQAGLAAST